MTERRRQWMWRLWISCVVLLILTVVASIRSFFAVNDYTCAFLDSAYQLETNGGDLFLAISPWKWWRPAPAPAALPVNSRSWQENSLFGFGMALWGDTIVMGAPMWTFIAAELAFGAWWLRHPRRHKTGPKGYCRKCNYDLRGSRDRCPECGTLFGSPLLVKPPPPARFIG